MSHLLDRMKMRRKSGSDADPTTSSRPKPPTTVASGNPHDNINIARSDGLRHDLISVFANPNIGNVIRESTALPVDATEELVDGEHDMISINRSDGLTHDLIHVFKGSGDPAADTSPSTLPPAPAPTPPPLSTKSRSISLTIKEFAKMATSSMKSTSHLDVALHPAGIASMAPVGWAPKSVRIVHMSDTHNMLDKNKLSAFLPHGDILVHTGSFTNRGTEDEYVNFNAWLSAVSGLYHYRIVCLGSRDVKLFGNDWDVMKRMLSNATHVLCHSEATVLGIRFYGSPWHWGHKHNYTIRPGAPSSTSGRFEDIPVGVHVLLTAVPAFHRLDATTAAEVKEHWGSRELVEHLRRARPGLHLHGHVKDSRGVLPAFGNSCLTINSSMVDKDITVLYACPHVIKATQTMTDSSNKSALNWSFALDTLDG